MARRRTGLGGAVVPGGTGSGGTPYNPAQKVPSQKPAPPTPEDTLPPYLSYDPSILAQREQDSRGLQTIGNQEQDINTKGERSNQDFATSLANIARSFGQLGHRQGESENAAGVNDAGTQAAASAARAQNQGLAEAPIRTAQGRENEDLATALGRLGTSRTQVGEDSQRSTTRLKQDHHREAQQAKRETHRKEFELNREKEQARTEEAHSQVDLLAQAIYSARAEHPAAFAQFSKEHPQAIAQAEGKSQANKETGGNVQAGIGSGHAASKKPKKKGR